MDNRGIIKLLAKPNAQNARCEVVLARRKKMLSVLAHIAHEYFVNRTMLRVLKNASMGGAVCYLCTVLCLPVSMKLSVNHLL